MSRQLDYSGSMSVHEEVAYLRNRCRRLEGALERVVRAKALSDAQGDARAALKPGQANISPTEQRQPSRSGCGRSPSTSSVRGGDG